MRKIRVSILLSFLSFFSELSFSQTPEPGQKAPEIKITGIVSTPVSGNMKKVIVLEFWATWCAPCVAAIPHLNDLEEKFSGKINFISMTSENVRKVKDFLTRHVMRSQVVTDTTGTTFKNYGITHIPQTFIIDTTGIIAWHGGPLDLNEMVLNSILSGQSIKSPDPGKSTLQVPWAGDKNESEDIVSVRVKRVEPEQGLGKVSDFGMKDSVITARWFNYSLAEIFADLYEISTTRVELKNFTGNYNVSVTLRGKQSILDDDSVLVSMVRNNLSAAFSFRPEKKMIEKEVYVLTISDKQKFNKYLDPDKDKGTHTSSNKEVWIGANIELPTFVNAFEEKFKVLLSDQTNTKGKYDLQFLVQDLASSTSDLESNYGLKLTKKKMKTEIWVLDFTKK